MWGRRSDAPSASSINSPTSCAAPTTGSAAIFPPIMAPPGEWALPVSATYVIDRDGTIIYAYTDVDYRDRANPRDVLDFLTRKAAAA